MVASRSPGAAEGEDMSKATVIIKRLRCRHDLGDLATFRPLSQEVTAEINLVTKEILDTLGGKSLLKSSGDVYVKPNAIDCRPYTYTRPEVVEAVIRYWFAAGARNVYLMENSTQGTYTRLVFEMAGYRSVCKRTGAIPVYLDEVKTVTLEFPGKGRVSKADESGYDLTEFQMPRIVAEKLIDEKDRNLYVNLPKLKTHSMGVVTLGIKNQWGFLRHADRSADHNYNLHSKLVDVLSYVRPDITLIEGVEGTIYGHYPALKFADKCVKPFGVLIGGLNVVATDIVGAAVFGLHIDDVPYIKMAIERGLSDGISKAEEIQLVGDCSDLERMDVIGDISEYGGKYPFDLYPEFPRDVAIIRGKERACREGCVNNPLTLLQILSYDFNGRGGWSLLMGKGFDPLEIERIKGPVLIVGKCAIEEVSDTLLSRLGKRKVYLSGRCNDLRATTEAMCHLTKVNPMKFVAANPVTVLEILIQANLHRTHAKLVNPACSILKMR
jgi:uncharacterized protein (DUF362 family)